MKAKAQFRLRIYRGKTIAVGPGKIALLEAVAETGSIAGAARRMGMSYRRAWMLLEELSGALRSPAIETTLGGAHGGGTRLTPVGALLIRRYRDVEATASRAAAQDLAALTGMLSP
ncbi:winged helix-turn-helix domain-containing protein [Comamonas badia]|jgi:molybdate transport system regulatory protein|uniref:winged helix-turn-helix domain-containing protein n=1 Tax=Comamonas badia TaxID=265291 RepID=UPI00040AD424|nr:LysR family transcriptional regulator [Comamonas badia]